jgi:hypothetical protein
MCDAKDRSGDSVFISLHWRSELLLCLKTAIICSLLAVNASAQEEEHKESSRSIPRILLEGAFDNLYSRDYLQTIDLIASSSGSRPVSKTLQILRRQRARPGKALVRFLNPSTIRRTSLLILENDSAIDDVYVYLPAIKLIRRISAAQRADSFFGTDLNYEDIEPKAASDFEVRTALKTFERESCSRLEVWARDGIDSTYDKMLLCVEDGRHLIHWIEYYRSGRIIKRLDVNLESVRTITGQHIPFEMTMTTLGANSKTRIVTQKYELVDGIPDSLFSTWNLQAGDAERDRRRVTRGD